MIKVRDVLKAFRNGKTPSADVVTKSFAAGANPFKLQRTATGLYVHKPIAGAPNNATTVKSLTLQSTGSHAGSLTAEIPWYTLDGSTKGEVQALLVATPDLKKVQVVSNEGRVLYSLRTLRTTPQPWRAKPVGERPVSAGVAAARVGASFIA